jgi:nicotinate-nucleotide adenylyltransferase
MPARMPPHKPLEHEAGAVQRLEMCRLLVESERRLSACSLELERDGPSYTVDSLSEVHASDPSAELTFIVGADIAATLPAWHEPGRLLELAELAVAARAGTDRRRVLDAIAEVAPARPRVRFLQAPLIDVSSSLVRERAAAQEPLEPLVGMRVAGYIVEHGLYGARTREASR